MAQKKRRVIVYLASGQLVEATVRRTFPDGRFLTTAAEILFRPDGLGVETFPRRLPMAVDWSPALARTVGKLAQVKKINGLWDRLKMSEGGESVSPDELDRLEETIMDVVTAVEKRERSQ